VSRLRVWFGLPEPVAPVAQAAPAPASSEPPVGDAALRAQVLSVVALAGLAVDPRHGLGRGRL